MLLALALSTVLAQSDAAAAQPVPAEPMSAADKAADAAMKAAEAAQKAAEAAMRIADAVAPAPAAATAAATPPAADGWKGSVGLGLTFITGNAQTLTLTGTAAADKKWDLWSLGIRLNGAYGLANPDTNTVGSSAATTARRAAGTIRGDRGFGSGFAAIFLLAGSEFDHMKNIESRTIGEAGASLTFFNKKEGDLEKLFLRFDLAARSGYESRFQYFPPAVAGDPVRHHHSRAARRAHLPLGLQQGRAHQRRDRVHSLRARAGRRPSAHQQHHQAERAPDREPLALDRVPPELRLAAAGRCRRYEAQGDRHRADRRSRSRVLIHSLARLARSLTARLRLRLSWAHSLG
ncbi:MAG: DUF481 domain-containing protein [Archangium sp.]